MPSVLPPDRLEHVAVAQQNPRLVGRALEHLLRTGRSPGRNRRAGPASPPCRLQWPSVIRLDLEISSSSSSASAGRPSRPSTIARLARAGGKVRGNFQRPPEQILGILQPPDPRRQFGQHADRADVERVFLEMRLEDPLGDIQAIFVQRRRGLDQPRMPAAALPERSFPTPNPSASFALAPSSVRR